MSAHEIVIGIDFGTTHSGVSWARNAGKKDVRVITDWPKQGLHNSNAEKVPSCISYKDGRPDKYGYLVGHEDKSFKWIKLLLDTSAQHARDIKPVEESNPLLPDFHKRPLDIVTDYLRWIWKYALDDITRYMPKSVMKNCDLKVVLTVPAIWEDPAKDQILQAARLAGMPSNIRLVAEPEAAALAVLREKADTGDLKVGDCFIVCDAGGGTVDLISYKIENLKPLQVKELTVGNGEKRFILVYDRLADQAGGLCGSAYLDMGFESYVSTVVGEETYDKLLLTSKKRMIDSFEYGIKRRFEDCSDEYSVELQGIKPDSKNDDVFDGIIRIKRNNLKPIFDKTFARIQDLVDDQVLEVKDGGDEVKAILLVGGLGESKYLYHRLEAANNSGCEAESETVSDATSEVTSEATFDAADGAVGIDVIPSIQSWSAVCRGATLWGLENSPGNTFLSRRARCSYGISINDPFDLSNLRERESRRAERRQAALRQMKWLLKRGEEYHTGHRRSVPLFLDVDIRFYNRGHREFKSELYYCDNAAPPKRKDSSIKLLCVLKASVSYAELGQEPVIGPSSWFGNKRCVEFSIEVLFGDAILEFQMWYRNKKVGSVTADYQDALQSGRT